MAYIGNSPYQGSITGGNIVDGSIESIDLATLTNIDINSGSIDGTIIGASSAAAGSFTTLNTTGNVGIGTSSPNYKLVVSGPNAAIQVLDTGTNTGTSNIYFGDADTATRGQINYNHVDESLRIVANAAERLRITSTGNVGIGTSSPSTQLHVAGSGGVYARITENNISGTVKSGLILERASTNTDFLIENSGNLTFSTASDASTWSERMRIDSSGNVGIGTTSPTANLSVGSTSTSSGDIHLRTTKTAATITPRNTDAGGLDIGVGWVSGGQGPMTFTIGASERMRIDSSGNLLVGKTTYDSTVAGGQIGANGIGAFTALGAFCGLFNRKGSDGDIAVFRKDGTTVGSIGTNSAVMYIGSDDVGFRFDATSNAVSPWNTTSAALNDGGIDIGRTTARFKDLYLSGGVYLGGTTVANQLDDYETGTFTPTLRGATTAGTLGYSVNSGNYTKVGNRVSFDLFLHISSISVAPTGIIQVMGLPFTSLSKSHNERHVLSYSLMNIDGTAYDLTAYTLGSNTVIQLLYLKDNAAWSVASTTDTTVGVGTVIQITGQYETA